MKPLHTVLRVLIGGLFVGHGAQKLLGWFGGHGIEGTGGFFESLDIRPGKQAAIMAGVSEAGGGLLLAAGKATPLAGAALTGTMFQAVQAVHADKGPWVSEGGWEYNAVLAAAVLAIVEEDAGLVWALLALAAGAVGPTFALRALRTADAAGGSTTPVAQPVPAPQAVVTDIPATP
jgi:putative oxidoreductase